MEYKVRKLIKIVTLLLLCLLLLSCKPKEEEIIEKQTTRKDTQQEEKNKEYEFRINTLIAHREVSYMAVAHLLKDKDFLNFYNDLRNETSKGKNRIVEYFLYKYPILITGNKNKLIHHHRLILSNKKLDYLKNNKVFFDPIEKNTFKVNWTDFSYMELEDYDNIRYIWWNPLVENFRDARWFSGMQDFYISNANPKESGFVILVSNFKANMKRTPENIWKLYNLYKKPVFQLLDKKRYKDLKIDLTVNRLIQAYDYYLKKEYNSWKNTFHKEIKNITRTDTDTKWYYTFWKRRFHEKNEEATYQILKEIQAHYK